jgi:hypothetical protein
MTVSPVIRAAAAMADELLTCPDRHFAVLLLGLPGVGKTSTENCLEEMGGQIDRVASWNATKALCPAPDGAQVVYVLLWSRLSPRSPARTTVSPG